MFWIENCPKNPNFAFIMKFLEKPTCPKLCSILHRSWDKWCKMGNWEKIDLQFTKNEYWYSVGSHFEASVCTFDWLKPFSKILIITNFEAILKNFAPHSPGLPCI